MADSGIKNLVPENVVAANVSDIDGPRHFNGNPSWLEKILTTKHNTGLSIARNGSKFTATWKIVAGNPAQQYVRWRTYDRSAKKWGAWTEKSISVKTTSYSITLTASDDKYALQVQTKICNASVKNSKGKWVLYYPSEYEDSTKKFVCTIPPKPSLAVSVQNASTMTFTPTSNAKATGTAWQYRLMRRKKVGNGAWSAWEAATSGTGYQHIESSTDKLVQFQVKAVGPAGESAVVTRYHYVGNPPAATLQKVTCSAHPTGNPTYYVMEYNMELKCKDYMVDKLIPEYFIGVPTTTGINCTGETFTSGQEYGYDDAKSKYTLDINTSDVINLDECLWAHVKTDHDGIEAISNVKRVITGSLKPPETTVTMGTPTSTGFSVTIESIDFQTTVPGAYAQVFLEKASKPGEKHYIRIGTILQSDVIPKTITSREKLVGEDGYSILIRNVSADGTTMKSAYDKHETTMPAAPTLLKVEPTDMAGKVFVDWTTNWDAANGVIISWTDDRDNWKSNEEPEEYEITSRVGDWFIKGLETGKTWYFKVRSVRTVGDTQTMSDWSNELSVDLSSAPIKPTLFLSEEVITKTDTVTAYWSYMTGDGTAQISGKVYQGTVSGGVFTPTKCVGATTTSQHVDINAKKVGWSNGQTVTLALKTGSASGGVSEYSDPVQLVIAADPTVSITSNGMGTTEAYCEHFFGDGTTTDFTLAFEPEPGMIVVDVDGTPTDAFTVSGDVLSMNTAPAEGAMVVADYDTSHTVLQSTPFSVVCATSNARTLTVAIERAEDYPMDRPDGTKTEGPAGETVFLNTVAAEASTTVQIDISKCFGRIDDGAWYNLVCTAADQYGRTAEATERFHVHWNHQAWRPTAEGEIDEENYIAKITPIAGTGWVSTDTCDIYRLSQDKPELIYEGAEFGTTYVDPYPAFTWRGGYKFVTNTVYKDYITPDGEIAEANYYTDFDPGTLVIDFGGDFVELPYNITLSSTWAKDHKRTTYLGGSVVGDYNKAVTRDVSAGTVLVRNADEELVQKMHALAVYTGHCHVRTPDGSSFEADVQVQESRAYNTAAVDYALTIQKTDTTGFDGMTLAEWEREHIPPEEE